jgi:glucosamine-6-phosphate deaminase
VPGGYGGDIMQIFVVDDSLAAADLAAQLMVEAHQQGARRYGLATGQTMVPVYRALVQAVHAARPAVEVSTWETFNLDEYVGIPAEHPGSFRAFMEEHLFGPLNVPRGRTHLLNGMASDLEAECEAYESLLNQGGLDYQLLGIGMNGHIGFNEPGTPWDSDTHRMRLTAETLEQNRALFPGVMPDAALTMGIGSILRAQKILVVATGPTKADAVFRAIAGPLDLACPASALQGHSRVQYVLDRLAAQKLLADRKVRESRDIIQKF